MKYRNPLAIVLVLALALALVACANFQNLSPEQKVAICQESLRVVAQPECLRLGEVADGRYVDLCDSVVEDAVVACDAGINEDPSVLCSRVSEHASECELIPDSSSNRDQNVATCERVVRALGLLCLVSTSDQVEGATPEFVEPIE